MNKKLAKIKSAGLEIKERGILTFWINVLYEDGLNQGIGGITLDDYDKEKKCRVGTAYGCELIRMLLLELSVNDFSEMKGLHIWVVGNGDGIGFDPKGIQSLKCDNKNSSPVIFKDVLESIS